MCCDNQSKCTECKEEKTRKLEDIPITKVFTSITKNELSILHHMVNKKIMGLEMDFFDDVLDDSNYYHTLLKLKSILEFINQIESDNISIEAEAEK